MDFTFLAPIEAEILLRRGSAQKIEAYSGIKLLKNKIIIKNSITRFKVPPTPIQIPAAFLNIPLHYPAPIIRTSI